MSRSAESQKTLSETIKNYAQILAVIIAAFWTLYIFILKEKPLLDQRGETSSELFWDSTGSNDTCMAVYQTKLENKGSTAINISKVRVRAWRFSRSKDENNGGYVEVNDALKGKPITDKEYSAKGTTAGLNELPFIERYPPGAKYYHSFEWEVKRDPTQLMFFRVDFYTDDNETQSEWHVSQWSQICAGVNNSKELSPPVRD